MASSLMASQSLILRNPNLLSPYQNVTNLSQSSTLNHTKPRNVSVFSRPNPRAIPSLRSSKPQKKFAVSASSSTVLKNPSANLSEKSNLDDPLFNSSTRTVTTLLAVTLAASKLFLHKFLNLAVNFKGFQGLVYSSGPMFFAAMRNSTSSAALNTPFTVVAAGMAKWLDIYSGVLMVRVLLSWFPNIPWDRQPLSAIRDLCDPYLNLFRNIIPPIFDTLDVSPLLAFAVLGTLGSILNSSRGAT